MCVFTALTYVHTCMYILVFVNSVIIVSDTMKEMVQNYFYLKKSELFVLLRFTKLSVVLTGYSVTQI